MGGELRSSPRFSLQAGGFPGLHAFFIPVLQKKNRNAHPELLVIDSPECRWLTAVSWGNDDAARWGSAREANLTAIRVTFRAGALADGKQIF